MESEKGGLKRGEIARDKKIIKCATWRREREKSVKLTEIDYSNMMARKKNLDAKRAVTGTSVGKNKKKQEKQTSITEQNVWLSW